MILSCPSCSTRYSVADAALRAGRTVRCAGCGHSWFAKSDQTAPDKPESTAPEQPPLAADEPPATDALEPAPARPRPHRDYRNRVEARKRKRRQMAAAGGWGSVAAALVIAAGLAWTFRLDVVRAFPRAAQAYAVTGADVNVYGLSIENLVSERTVDQGEPALAVRAELRNIDRKERTTPYVRFDLRDAEGQAFFAWTVTPERAMLEPGETVGVAAILVNPPERANDVVMTLTETPILLDTQGPAAADNAPPPPDQSGHS